MRSLSHLINTRMAGLVSYDSCLRNKNLEHLKYCWYKFPKQFYNYTQCLIWWYTTAATGGAYSHPKFYLPPNPVRLPSACLCPGTFETVYNTLIHTSSTADWYLIEHSTIWHVINDMCPTQGRGTNWIRWVSSAKSSPLMFSGWAGGRRLICLGPNSVGCFTDMRKPLWRRSSLTWRRRKIMVFSLSNHKLFNLRSKLVRWPSLKCN